MRKLFLIFLTVVATGCATHRTPPVSPILYEVAKGDTLSGLAAQFAVAEDTIAELNDIPDDKWVRAGTWLQLPEVARGEATVAALQPVSVEKGQRAARRIELGVSRRYVARLVWPIRGARLSSPFGSRPKNFHEGLDLSAPEGTTIYAAHDGEVVYAGRGLNGYGRVVVLRGDGIATVYAHNSSNHVDTGERVRAGQKIAAVGKTGDASGPHLHFEIRVQDGKKQYVAVDPLAFYRRVESRTQMASMAAGTKKKGQRKG